MSSEMIGEEPAVTEDSDLVDIIRELYRGKIGRNRKTAEYCVGGALCHSFSKEHKLQEPYTKFPFVDHLTEELMYIIEQHGEMNAVFAEADALDVQEINDACNYYASAIINANDSGNYDDAWIHVDMFLKEFGIDAM